MSVGDGEEGYNAITSAFGTYARVIILNPLHPNLPRLLVLIMPICNKFDSDFVFRLLLIVWYYVEIFCSCVATHQTRIKYAATVTHFLAIWHNYVQPVQRHPDLSLRRNCMTRETYVDVLISCHFAVLLISYMRDNVPHQECRLDLTGSDVLEDYWSKNGQWVGNHHNYNFCDLQRNTSHMIRLEQIRVDPSAPEFAKPHPKQESIWARQYLDGFTKVRLDD